MRRIFFITALSLLSLLWLRPIATFAAQPALVVVVAPESPLRDVSSADLRKLFLRNSTTLGGRPAVPLNHPPGTPDRLQFDQQVLGMREAEVGRYWVDRRVRGESAPPHTIASVPLLRRVVTKLTGAVAYMRVTEADSTVRVLLVDGKGPKDAGYALR